MVCKSPWPPTFLTSSHSAPATVAWVRPLPEGLCTDSSVCLEYTSPRSPRGSLLDSSKSMFRSNVTCLLRPLLTRLLKLQPHSYLVSLPCLAGWFINFYTAYIIIWQTIYYIVYCLPPPIIMYIQWERLLPVLISPGSWDLRTVPTIKQALNKYLLNEETGKSEGTDHSWKIWGTILSFIHACIYACSSIY